MRINLFFITYEYNTLLLDYDIIAAVSTKNRGARTPAELGNKINRKFWEAFYFTQAVISYA